LTLAAGMLKMMPVVRPIRIMRIPAEFIYKRSIRAYEISIQIYCLAGGTPFDCGVLLPSRNSGGESF